jgi:hypothetical protein
MKRQRWRVAKSGILLPLQFLGLFRVLLAFHEI